MTSHLKDIHLKHKKVLLRADLNVPLKHGIIQDTFRLERIQPTLDYLVGQQAIILIVTHLGNPSHPDPAYSTACLLDWFKAIYQQVEFASTLEAAKEQLNTARPGAIVLLENIRFFKGEKEHDPGLAKTLHAFTDIYVNDAFGVIHRKDTSVTLLAQMFDQHSKTIGFLMQEELTAFNSFTKHTKDKSLIILGGAKIKTKLPLIPELLKHTGKILVCPPLSFCFDKAQKYEIGDSFIEESMVPVAHHILDTCGTSLVLPVGYQIAYEGALSVVSAHQIPADAKGIAIGPQTLNIFKRNLATVDVLFFNGAMGFIDQPDTLTATHNLLQEIKSAPAYSIAGGGDTVATIAKLALSSSVDFLSTGGGSALALLAHKNLPGLETMR